MIDDNSEWKAVQQRLEERIAALEEDKLKALNLVKAVDGRERHTREPMISLIEAVAMISQASPHLSAGDQEKIKNLLGAVLAAVACPVS